MSDIGQGKREAERHAPTRRAIGLDATSLRLHREAAEQQAETASALLLATGRELLEEPVPHAFRKAGAVVHDLNQEHSRLLGAGSGAHEDLPS
jgi:hypothetical protein